LFRAGGVGDDGPVVGRGDGQLEAAFQVGLVETGEGHARVHGDEEGVEVFAAVVVVFEAGDGFAGGGDVGSEFYSDEVFARAKGRGGQDDVAVLDLGRDGRAVERDAGNVAVAEVEEERRRGVGEVEANLLGGFSGGRVRDEAIAELVMQIGDTGGAFLGEGAGDAIGNFGGVRCGGC
jgi:hypothetical protein